MNFDKLFDFLSDVRKDILLSFVITMPIFYMTLYIFFTGYAQFAFVDRVIFAAGCDILFHFLYCLLYLIDPKDDGYVLETCVGACCMSIIVSIIIGHIRNKYAPETALSSFLGVIIYRIIALFIIAFRGPLKRPKN